MSIQTYHIIQKKTDLRIFQRQISLS